jgi:hypothetical protein
LGFGRETNNVTKCYAGKGGIDIDGRIILKWIKIGVRVLTGFIWLRIESSGGIL